MYDAPGSVSLRLCFCTAISNSCTSVTYPTATYGPGDCTCQSPHTDEKSIRYVLISESVIKATEPAHYFSRGQRVQFVNMLREENDRLASKDGHRGNVEGEDGRIQGAEEGYAEGEEEEGGADLRAYG